MTLRTLARRYASALFAVTSRNGDSERASRSLEAFQQLVASHPDLGRVFESPAVTSQQKRAIVEELLARSGEEVDEVGRLLLMLAERDRFALLPEIVPAFAERLLAARHVVPAEIVTAIPLPVAQRDRLAQALKDAAGSDVTMTETVDPSIVGGLIARVGSVVFDGSITRQVARMRLKLTEAS
jgi:F-type H+-transporting ATPase subunit delta